MDLDIEFTGAANVAEAVEAINSTCFDAAILDVRLPGVTGLSLGAEIRERDVNIPLAYLTNLDTPTVRAEAIAQRASYWPKLQFIGDDQGIQNLLTMISEMAQLNPCVEDGVRIDNHGHRRKLPQTPFKVPEALDTLLTYSILANRTEDLS